MSLHNPGQSAEQLRQDIQRELITANQLLVLISSELQLIEKFTNPGGEFEMTVKNNASLTTQLANLCQIDVANIPAVVRNQIDISR